MKIFISGFRNETTEEIQRIIIEADYEAVAPYFSGDKRGDEASSCKAAIFDSGSRMGIDDHAYAYNKGMKCLTICKRDKVRIPEHSSVTYFSNVLYYGDIEELRGIIKGFLRELNLGRSKERLPE